MLIDTHAHLAHKNLINQIDSVISNAQKEGVSKTISIGCSISEAEKSIELAQKYPGVVFATAGLYPHDNKNEDEIIWPIESRLTKIKDLAKSEEVVAIGEMGLDYTAPPEYEAERSTTDQIKLFKDQIEIAQELNKPFIIHSRNATSETLQVLKQSPKNVKWVWHCFAEGPKIAEKVIELGGMISFTGIVTYKNSPLIKESARIIPIENIMIETDCPYLTPHKARSSGVKVNEPAYVRMVAQEIAEIRKISFEEFAEKTTENAVKFFNLSDNGTTT